VSTQTSDSAVGPDALPFWHPPGLWKIAISCGGVRRRSFEDERNTARTGIPAPQLVTNFEEAL
jgi:hypothetical protein